MSKITCITTIKEQCQDALQVQIKVNILSENGQLWIQPEGYGGKDTVDGIGWPIGIEIWNGKLRFVVYDDIVKETPQILDLTKAQEECRYCKAAEYLAENGRKIFTDSLIGGFWNAACISASILSNKQGDKAAYEYLLNFSDKYLQDLPPDEKRLWQQVMAKAITLFKILELSDETKTEAER